MTKDDLFKFYEKLYFHEIEMREKLNARIQTYLAIIAAQFGFIAFIINNTQNLSLKGIGLSFIMLLSVTTLLLFLAIIYFVRSWYNYEYAFLPSANDTEDYRNQLIETYKNYDDAESLVENALKDYIYKYYAECSSNNTENNDRRSLNFHKTATVLIFSFCFSLITIALFYLTSLKFYNK